VGIVSLSPQKFAHLLCYYSLYQIEQHGYGVASCVIMIVTSFMKMGQLDQKTKCGDIHTQNGDVIFQLVFLLRDEVG
jgi:hypothetical protein